MICEILLVILVGPTVLVVGCICALYVAVAIHAGLGGLLK